MNPDILADDNSERVLNLIYVSQDNAYEIPAYLLEPINLLELPEGSIRLHSIIGRGEFGKVYLGDAQGINKDSEWTTVAIKTLTGSIVIEFLFIYCSRLWYSMVKYINPPV